MKEKFGKTSKSLIMKLIVDSHLRKSENFSVFKKNILKFIRPSQNSVCNCHNPRGICPIARLRLGSSYLRDHKFTHGFQDTR